MAILVTGGAGYIGTHTCVELLANGFEVIVADNLANSSKEAVRRVEEIAQKNLAFYQVDLCDEKEARKIFARHPNIEAVIHFAALKAVGESVQKPLEYYFNNLTSTLVVLKLMREFGVNNFVFSSSATVYGDPQEVPVKEDFPTSTTNPYGTTKLFIERILTDICKAEKNFNMALLRYFNPIGAHPSGKIGEDPAGIPNNLVPYIAQVAVGKLEKVNVFGNDYPTKDGTGVRDYIHVVDLAKGHVAALKKLREKPGLFVCNLGTGVGYSVLEVIAAFGKACQKDLPYKISPRRQGDIAAVFADPAKAKKELGWVAQFGIEEMCRDSWRWQSANPNGYSVNPQANIK